MTKINSAMQIAKDQIHVWVVDIRVLGMQCATLRSWLDRQELERALRIPHPQKRRSFVVVHGVLRCLLARYLACNPTAIELVIDPLGKPQLTFPQGVQFNTSRSGDWAAFAFSTNCTVGVDLEQLRSLPELPNVIRRVLCEEEAAELMQLPESDRDRGFFCCWTRKEAYSKAVGLGLLTPFDKFCVAAHPDTPGRLIHIGSDAASAAAWAIDDLPIPPGYAGALAYPGPRRRILVNPMEDLSEIIRVTQGRTI